MYETELRSALRECQFTSEIGEEHLENLAAVASWVEYPTGTVIFREGSMSSEIYLIIEGSVSLEICAPGAGCRRILTVGKGELLGWSPVLEHAPLTATARTIVDTTAVQINAGQVLTLCEHNPRFGYEFMRRAAVALAKRLSATRLQLLDVYGTEMPPVAESQEEES
jgi:CRP/FNR family cyclic AMP-dependent transcriptional regulator